MFTDLLKIKGLGSLLRSAWTWRLVRAVFLLLMLAMIAFGWHHHAIPGVEVPDPLMYLNFATHFFWVLWIMIIVVVALLFGRAWCTVCPLGWLNGLVSRFGLGASIPRWLQGLLPVTLVLIVLQLSVYLFTIHRFPDYTAWLLTVVLILTVTAGLVFRGRAFCTLLCPAGALFGLYARVAPFHLRVRESSVCDGCESQACIATTPIWNRFALGPGVFYWRSGRAGCPVDLVPQHLTDSVDCTLCLNCVKQCDKDNILVGRRSWLADFGSAWMRRGETLFFVVLLGLLTANFSKVYVDLRDLVFWVPEQTAQLLGWQVNGFQFLACVWIALLLPLLLLLPGLILWRLSETQTGGEAPPVDGEPVAETEVRGDHTGFGRRLGALALPLIPLLLAVHLILAVVKLNAKIGYLPLVLQDPSGVRSYLALNVMQTITPPGVLVTLDILKWLVSLILLAGFSLSIVAARRCCNTLGVDRGYLFGVIVSALIVGGMTGATIFEWLFVR
ncbi:MAG: hypothetical protein C0616_06850 [Desulfuromonas sp.]|nr:MAG: hypothetical protein C0616_06850 [Desulfuromonas sp.]